MKRNTLHFRHLLITSLVNKWHVCDLVSIGIRSDRLAMPMPKIITCPTNSMYVPNYQICQTSVVAARILGIAYTLQFFFDCIFNSHLTGRATIWHERLYVSHSQKSVHSGVPVIFSTYFAKFCRLNSPTLISILKHLQKC